MGAEKKASGNRPLGIGVSGSEQPEVPNADETVRKDVKEKPAKELPRRQANKPVGARLVIVSGTECDGFRIKGKDTLVGYCAPVGVLAEIAVHMHWSLKGRFGVGVPFDPSQAAEEPSESGRVFQLSGVFRKVEFAFSECFCQGLEEFTAEDLCQGPYRDQKVVFRGYPSGPFLVDTAGSDDDVKVDVEHEFLVPRMKDGSKPGQGLETRPGLGKLQ